jgi:nucleotide-binding universal stress UspA family protein
MAYRNIVVGIDGSESSQRALQRAVRLARAEGGQPAVLGVEELLPVFAGAHEAAQAWRNGRLHAAVEAAVGVARQEGIAAEGQVLAGYPAEVIVTYSTERHCDLIVVGAGDRPGGSLGGTADKVVDRAPCAVLVVR